MAKKKVNYYVFMNSEGCDLIVEDGGVASCHNANGYLVTDYYHNRITKQTKFKDIWDELAEGEMSYNDWDGSKKDKSYKEKVDDEVIQDMIDWLYCSTENCTFVRNDMTGELNSKSFKKLLPLLTLEDGDNEEGDDNE